MTRVKAYALILIIWTVFYTTIVGQAQEQGQPIIEISHPLPGGVAQGLLQISGTIEVDNFLSYTLEFSFQESADEAWFLISEGNSNISDSVLGEWDTSSIPDGNYKLRLTVNRQTDEAIILLVEGIRVRNYSQIETDTPVPTSEILTITPTITETSTATSTPEFKITPTPLPPNPASISLADIQNNILWGAILGVAIFVIFLLYRTGRNRT